MLRVELSRLDLDDSQCLRRDPPRPPEHRDAGYEDIFDFLTVLYDCFLAADARHVVGIGPPLLNLEPMVAPAIERAFCRLFFPRFEVRNLDRHTQIWLRPRVRKATFDGGLFKQRTIAVQPNHCQLFRGQRVLVTTSKDNELVWIRDWVRFHASNHGCNAVLFYDNGSTKYGLGDLYEVIATVPGIDVAVVVNWPFTFGPQAGASGIWDSDFSQYGILEHAHHRFLAAADAVINSDVDELVVTENCRSVFDLAKSSRTGYLQYAGVMIENVAARSINGTPRHQDFAYHGNPPRSATRKWTVAPGRCDPQVQWRVHQITDMQPDQDVSDEVAHRHFAAINTGWRYVIPAPSPPGETDVVDAALQCALRRVTDE